MEISNAMDMKHQLAQNDAPPCSKKMPKPTQDTCTLTNTETQATVDAGELQQYKTDEIKMVKLCSLPMRRCMMVQEHATQHAHSNNPKNGKSSTDPTPHKHRT